MKLLDLKTRFRFRPIFKVNDLHPTELHSRHELVQLNRWVKEGQVVRIIRGVYTLPDRERGVGLDALWLANNLHAPSYVSGEYALSHYGLIPEAAGTVTSVSTRKTAAFSTPMGRFVYHSVKQRDFFGFKAVKVPGGSLEFWIATPEKAVIDFIHLRVPRTAPPTVELFSEGYRFQNIAVIDKAAFADMAVRFTARTSRRHIDAFAAFLGRGGVDD